MARAEATCRSYYRAELRQSIASHYKVRVRCVLSEGMCDKPIAT